MYKNYITLFFLTQTWAFHHDIASIQNNLQRNGDANRPYILFRDAIVHERGVLVTVPCVDCLLYQNGLGGWSNDRSTTKNEMLLDLTVSSEGDSILLNNLPLYPPPSAAPQHAPPKYKALQTPSNTTRSTLVSMLANPNIAPIPISGAHATWDLSYVTALVNPALCKLDWHTSQCVRLEITHVSFQGRTFALDAKSQPVLYLGMSLDDEENLSIGTLAVVPDDERSLKILPSSKVVRVAPGVGRLQSFINAVLRILRRVLTGSGLCLLVVVASHSGFAMAIAWQWKRVRTEVSRQEPKLQCRDEKAGKGDLLSKGLSSAPPPPTYGEKEAVPA